MSCDCVYDRFMWLVVAHDPKGYWLFADRENAVEWSDHLTEEGVPHFIKKMITEGKD